MQRRKFLRDSLLVGATLPSLVACFGGDGGGGGAGGGSPDIGGGLSAAEIDKLTLPGAAFRHGVASGDPTAEAIILWTAVSPVSDAVESIPLTLEYVVSDQRLSDEADWAALFERRSAVRRLGSFLAHQARDWTVKVDLGNVALYDGVRFGEGRMEALPAGSDIYYRFVAGSQRSRIGRASTQRLAPVAAARFAVASCSNLPKGFFSVYDMISQQDDLDFVVHLGDYIYEYGEGEYGEGAALERDGENRVPEPAHEMVSRQDYVMRHAQYKRDRELQALHARFPMIAVWDDHEITNDAWREGAENHTTATEGDYLLRKQNAIRAYFNWMPLREQFARQTGTLLPDEREVIYRRIRVGDLMDLIMLDTRIVGRDQQASLPTFDVSRFDPSRSLLGDTQRSWLQLQLLEAKNQGAQWTFLGQQVMFGQLNLLELPSLGVGGLKLDNLVALNMDQWDGYAVERDRVREFVRSIGLKNLVVLTGDIHTSWAIELYKNPFLLLGAALDQPFGVEFVAPSVTSPGFPDGAAEAASALLPLLNPHIRYSELKTHGYVLVTVTREKTVAEWRYATSITDPAQIGVEDLAKRRTFEVAAGSSRLNDVTPGAIPCIPGLPCIPFPPLPVG